MFSQPVRFHSSLQCVDWDFHSGVNERSLFPFHYVSNGVFFVGFTYQLLFFRVYFFQWSSQLLSQQRCQKTLQVLKIDRIHAKFSVWNESSKHLQDHYSVLEQAEPIQMGLWAVQTRVCVATDKRAELKTRGWEILFQTRSSKFVWPQAPQRKRSSSGERSFLLLHQPPLEMSNLCFTWQS